MDKVNINLGTQDVNLADVNNVLVRATEYMTAHLLIANHSTIANENRKALSEKFAQRIGNELFALINKVQEEYDQQKL